MTQTISNFAEIEEKEQYRIISVDATTNKGFSGISVSLNSIIITDKTQYKAMLWFGQNEVTGSSSKLGTFIEAFTNYFEKTIRNTQEAIDKAQETTNWLGHTIKVVSWRAKKRQIEVVS